MEKFSERTGQYASYMAEYSAGCVRMSYDELATRYKKYDKRGNFRKHGITYHEDPAKRYSKKQIDGGSVEFVVREPRSKMIQDERREVETNPGPDNHEPWAGTKTEEPI